MADTQAPRVRWTDQEWFDVLTAAKIDPADSGAEFARKLLRAQKKAMPAKRRRSAKSLSYAGIKLGQRILARMAEGWTPVDAVPPTSNEHAAEPAMQALPVRLSPADVADPLAERLLFILSDTAAKVASATRERIMQELDARMASILAALAATMREQVNEILAAELGPLQAAMLADKQTAPAASARRLQ
jgi:hypothetical protein